MSRQAPTGARIGGCDRPRNYSAAPPFVRPATNVSEFPAATAPSPARARRRRRAYGLLFGVVLALVLAEVVLRIGSALLFPPIYELDDRCGWLHARNVERTLTDENGREIVFATDARGLRTTPHGGVATGDRRRILFVGDSFTAGSEVAAGELFTARVEAAMGEVEVWNAGVGGYSTLQELRLLEQILPVCSPRAVVLVVYENDLVDNLMPYFSGLGPRPHVVVRDQQVQVVDAPDLARFARFLMPAPAAFWCYRHLASYRALHKNLFLPSAGERLASLEQSERAAVPAADQRIAMAWLLAQTSRVVRATGSQLLLVAIPTRDQVRAGAAAAHDWLRTWCAEHDVPFLSTLPALQQAGAAAYFELDIHLTAAGHDSVARVLAPFLGECMR